MAQLLNNALRVISAFVFSALLFSAIPVVANDSRVFGSDGNQYEATFRHPALEDEAVTASKVKISWDAALKMGSLYGEPVVSTRFRYTLYEDSIALPTFGPGKFQLWSMRDDVQDAATLPEAAPPVYPHSVTLLFRFFSPAQNAKIDVTQMVEAPGLPGVWAFNMPQSPEWADVFVGENPDGDGRPVSADLAKEIWDDPDLQLQDVQIAELHWSTADLMAYLAENNMRNRAIATAEAFNRLLSGASRSFGYKIGGMRVDRVQFDQPAFRPAVPIALLRQYERLLSLPDKLKHGDPTAYEKARDDAVKIMALMEDDQTSYAASGPKRLDLVSGTDFWQHRLQPIFIQLPLVFTVIGESRDAVEITVKNQSGVAYTQIVDISEGGVRVAPAIEQGAVLVAIRPLGEMGETSRDDSACTLEIVSQVVHGPAVQNCSLKAGDSETMLIFAEAP